MVPLFVDALSGSSVSVEAQICSGYRRGRAQGRILATSGFARYNAPWVKERATVRLQTTWHKIYQQWVVLSIDNWYDTHNN